jgi:hypothetical protein
MKGRRRNDREGKGKDVERKERRRLGGRKRMKEREGREEKEGRKAGREEEVGIWE